MRNSLRMHVLARSFLYWKNLTVSAYYPKLSLWKLFGNKQINNGPVVFAGSIWGAWWEVFCCIKVHFVQLLQSLSEVVLQWGHNSTDEITTQMCLSVYTAHDEQTHTYNMFFYNLYIFLHFLETCRRCFSAIYWYTHKCMLNTLNYKHVNNKKKNNSSNPPMPFSSLLFKITILE